MPILNITEFKDRQNRTAADLRYSRLSLTYFFTIKGKTIILYNESCHINYNMKDRVSCKKIGKTKIYFFLVFSLLTYLPYYSK